LEANAQTVSRRIAASSATIAVQMGLVVVSLLLPLTGCNLAPKYSVPVVATAPAFKEIAPVESSQSANWKAAEPKDEIVRGKWWEMFDDVELNRLEEQSTDSNQSVAAAVANFLAARAIVKQAQSQYYPTLTTTPSVTRSRTSYTLTQAGQTATLQTSNEFSLPLDAAWEVDLWGRVRNTVKANRLEAQATLADLESMRLSVHADVASDYLQLRALDSEEEIAGEEVAADQESLKLTEVQFEAKMLSGQDVALAETLLDTARAQADDIGIQRALFEHAIATLTGTTASSFTLESNATIITLVAIPTGVPSQLLERRPDIAAAERRVAEANARIGVARAAYFPTLTLGGSAASQSSSLGNLMSGPSLVWSVGASLAQTLFDGGERRAVTEQSRAIYQGTVASYRETVLSAFQDVEDNLATLRILSQELRAQDAAVISSQHYLNLAQVRYTSGLDSYLDVAIAQTTLLTNRRAAINLRMEQMAASVQLVKALGGGWDASKTLVSAKYGSASVR
jgi:NodT family efflux transporter outer membrane factor (OMF) lipoprotein